MKQKVNFIQHFKHSWALLEEKNASPFHKSMYVALFMIWNDCGFEETLSVNRHELMSCSSIGSLNTYTKVLRELDDMGLIKYEPSFKSWLGSKIHLYTFDKGGVQEVDRNDTASDKGTDKGSSKGTDKGGVQEVVPYLNSLNLLNKETEETLKTPSNPQTPKEDESGNGIYFCKDGRQLDLNNIKSSKWRDNDGFEFLKSIGQIVGLNGTDLPGFHDAVKHLIETDHKIGDHKKFFIKMLTNHLKDCGL